MKSLEVHTAPPHVLGRRALAALCALYVTTSLGRSTEAHAQGNTAGAATTGEPESPRFGANAVVHAPVASTHHEDATASATAIEVEEAARSLTSLPEVLQRLPGTRVRSQGTLGGFSGVSLRGADLAQTTVMLGSLPLDSAQQGTFDLGLLPLTMLDEVVVYRGGAPAWLNQGAVGGVVQLIPQRARRSDLEGNVGVGSFGRHHLSGSVRLSRPSSDAHLLGHVALDDAENDFPYRRTLGELSDEDDQQLRLRNADALQGSALLHLGTSAAGGQVEALLLGVERSQGIPGSQKAPTPDARRQLTHVQFQGAYRRGAAAATSDGERLELAVSAGLQLQRVSDPFAQIGRTYPAETRDLSTFFGGRAASTFNLDSYLQATAAVGMRYETYAPENPLSLSRRPPSSSRLSESFVGELRLHGNLALGRAELRLSSRAEISESQIGSIRDAEQRSRQAAMVPTRRLAAAFAPSRHVTLSGSVSDGARLPTIVELFGDRAFLEESPELRPERSLAADVGIVVSAHAHDLQLRGELRGFYSHTTDLINFVRTSQRTARATNVSEAKIMGLEAGLSATLSRFHALTVALTALDTRAPSGYMLPFRPPLVLHGGAQTGLALGEVIRSLRLFLTLDVTSYNYTDDKGLGVIPGRQWVGAGAAMELSAHAEVQVRAENIFDQESRDLNGFWLPRRAMFASLMLKETL